MFNKIIIPLVTTIATEILKNTVKKIKKNSFKC